jgi:hypothetical protein
MNRLTEIGMEFRTDKAWYHNYTEFYYDYFIEFSSPRIIEVGTAGHGSSNMFLKFFKNPYIVGMDIIDYSDFKHPNFRFVLGDQTNINDLKKCVENEEHFDIILDDGGHTMKQQQITFGFLMDYVKSNGYYILEDLHTSFNNGFIENINFITSYDMLLKIQNKEIPFSDYISIEQQKNILEKIDWIKIYTKNPKDLRDSVTSIIKIKK